MSSAAPAHAQAGCPSCGSRRSETIYSLSAVPVHSTLLLPDAASARAFPNGALELRWCPGCGLAFNAAFDDGLVDYRSAYRDSQAASPTFLGYATALARDWVARHGLTEGRVVEIGCGQGEFLRLICEEARATGLGFDPAYAGEAMVGDVAFRAEAFTERHVPLEADFLVCRHTLEHIGDTAGFLDLLRRAAGARGSMRIGCEVPDFRRILTEAAFWDVYYEHACYFTAGGLARAFAAAGFAVLDLRRVYGGQYLVIEAAPGRQADGPSHPLADDMAETARLVADFRTRSLAAIGAWRACFDAWQAAGHRVALWGSGSKAVGFLTSIGRPDGAVCVVDINPERQGRYMPGCGMPIVAPADVPALAPDKVVVMNPIYEAEIGADLRRLGLASEVCTADRLPAAEGR